MGFYDDIQNELNHSDNNKILTKNGAIAHRSAGNSLVDFNYSVPSLRNKTPEEIVADFKRCYIDDPKQATKLLFQIGDVREGKGERRTFNICLRYLAKEHPEVAKALLPLVPEYTRWDHVAEMVTCGEPKVQRFARKMIAEQLTNDFSIAHMIEQKRLRLAALNESYESAQTSHEKAVIDHERQSIQKYLESPPSMSLCAKWTPALGAVKPGHHKIALRICDEMKLTHSQYRSMRAMLLKHLNVLEVALSTKQLDGVNFEHLTAGQQAKYREVLQNKVSDAYEEYLDKVASGEAKMHADTLTPAQVVHMYCDSQSSGKRMNVLPYNQPIELLWDNLKQVDGNGMSCIVVRDDSGSMMKCCSNKTSMRCLEVATALALYCAERLPGEFKDKFLSFSNNPKYLDVSPFNSLHDKLQYCATHAEVSKTNIQKTFDLLLSTALNHNMKQEDLPSSVLILSDMEFDGATDGNDKALFDNIRQQWAAVGYQMPTIAFWNLNAERTVVPDVHPSGVVLLSGFNVDNLNIVMNDKLKDFTPAKQLAWVLSNERYDAVETAFYEGLARERRSGATQLEVPERAPDDGYTLVDEETEEIEDPYENTVQDYPCVDSSWSF